MEADLVECPADHPRGRGDHGFGQRLVLHRGEFLACLRAAAVRLQKALQYLRVVGEGLGDGFAGAGENHRIGGFQGNAVKRGQQDMLPPLDKADGDVAQARELSGDRFLADQRAVRGYFHLDNELLARHIHHIALHRAAFGQDARNNDQGIDQTGNGQHGTRNGEIEKADLRLPGLYRGGHDQQVGGGADQRRHATEDGGVAQRDHQGRGRAVQTLGQGGHQRDEDDHHRRIVHEGADQQHGRQHHGDGQHRMMAAQRNKAADRLFQRPGTDNALPHHQQREYGDQRRIGDPGQNLPRSKQVFSGLIHQRVEMEQQQQPRNDRDGGNFQLDPLVGEGDNRDGDKGKNRPDMKC